MIVIAEQELADEKHKDEAGQHHGEGGCQAAHDAPCVAVARIDHAAVTHIGGAVDADGARRALADGHDVGELAGADPMVVVHNLGLYHGNHGIAPTKAKQTDEEECPEEF